MCNYSGITLEHVEEVALNADFEVYSYEEHPFKGLSHWDLRNKLGLLGMPAEELAPLPVGEKNYELPADFVSNDKWPECIHPIRDQQRCGSCWAFAASEVLSDRFCIASEGKVNVVLSPQDMVSCDKQDLGCNGGYLDRSWNYLKNNGIVSDECYPYTSGSGVTGTCKVTNKCVDGKTDAVKYKVSSWKQYRSSEEVKEDIFNHGPVETGFLVYQDFMSYKGGIYKKTSNTLLGGHAVKIVGWGTDKKSNTEYWVVANSWGPNWGEKGHFRIQMNHCCNFETGTISGTPQYAHNYNMFLN
jgi:cathepsin B